MIIEPPDGLVEMLKVLHKDLPPTPDQSVRGGTQLTLLESPYKRVHKALRALDAVLPSGRFVGVWSNYLLPGHYNVRHIHPKGELSGVWYLEVQDGKLCFDDHDLMPVVGQVVTFPSDKPHWVESAASPRLSIAFDRVTQYN